MGPGGWDKEGPQWAIIPSSPSEAVFSARE